MAEFNLPADGELNWGPKVRSSLTYLNDKANLAYTKPITGIPEADLDQSVVDKLNKVEGSGLPENGGFRDVLLSDPSAPTKAKWGQVGDQNLVPATLARTLGLQPIEFDPLMMRSVMSVNDLLVWNSTNRVKIAITEVGVPSESDATYDPRWVSVARFFASNCQNVDAPFVMWTSSQWDIDLKMYDLPETSTEKGSARTVAEAVEPFFQYNSRSGVNVAGGEFGSNGKVLTKRGVEGTDYKYPDEYAIKFLAARGVPTIRVPFRWERLQPSLEVELDNFDLAEVARYRAVLDLAAKYGISVIADMHNYGSYTVFSGQTSTNYDLGSNAPQGSISTTMNEAFAAFWAQFVNNFGSHPGLGGYGLLNEPYDLPGGYLSWQAASDAAALAVRQREAFLPAGNLPKDIYVSGYQYANARGWTDINGATAWLYSYFNGRPLNEDPQVYFEAHVYFDGTEGGKYTRSYDDYLSDAEDEGFTSGTTYGQDPSKFVRPVSGIESQHLSSAIRARVLNPVDSVARTLAGTAVQTSTLNTRLATKSDTTHKHVASDLTDSTATGRSLISAASVIGAKTTLGLQNVDNTSDANKPVSTATATALGTKANTVHTHTANQISDSSTVGRSVLTATDLTEARRALEVRSDPMPALLRAFLALRQVAPVQIGWFGSSTIQGNNATSADKSVVNLVTGMIQRAYNNGITPDESAVQSFNSATKQTVAGVHSYNAGIGGTGTGNYLTDTMVTRATSTLGLNVRIHAATTNDLRNGINPETSKTNLQSWITKLKAAQPGPAIDILIQSYTPWDGTYTYAPTEYTRIMREIAADPVNNGTVFFFDISDAFVPLGVPPTSTYGTDILDIIDTDNLHQNDKGHAYMAEVLRNRLGIPVENIPIVLMGSTETVKSGTAPETLVFTRTA